MAETWPWSNPRAAWADVAVALRAAAEEPERPGRVGVVPRHRRTAASPGVRPIRQIIHGLWTSHRLSEDGAAEALALSIVVPTWTPADGVPVEDIFWRCKLVLDNLDDSSPNELVLNNLDDSSPDKHVTDSGRWRAVI